MPRLVPVFVFSCVAPALSCLAAASQRVIVADFEDVGTWRASSHPTQKPGVWFAGGIWMGTSLAPAHADLRSGEIRFAFDEKAKGPLTAVFKRAKMSLVAGTLDGIEFDADSRGRPVSLRFVLQDRDKKLHTTPAVKLGGAGWKSHRLALDAKSWPKAAEVAWPATLDQVVLVADEPCAGSILLDDLALTGEFDAGKHVSIFPMYSGIDYDPGSSVTLRYRLRNARPAPVSVVLAAEVEPVDRDDRRRVSRTVELPARGQAVVELALGELPAGPWTAKLQARDAKDGGALADYLDSFAVFTPNGGRVNDTSWFGVQDFTIWQGEAEGALHMAWMRAIGFDLNRMGVTGARFRPAHPVSLELWKPFFEAFEQAGIDLSILHMDMTPELMSERGWRGPPTDLAAYERYSAELGRFLSRWPRVKYVEFFNEPDIEFFEGDSDEYWAMFAAFSRGFRSTAPGIKIATGGGTVRHPREKAGFNEALYSKHPELYDIAAFHAHGRLSNYTTRYEQIKEWQKHAGFAKPIVNTESGERSGYEARGLLPQAETLVKKLGWAKARPDVEFHVWFTLQDYWDMDVTHDDSWGLVTSDNRPKPALVAYNELIRQLARTTPRPASFSEPGIDACEFARADGRHVLLCWASDGGTGAPLWIRPAGREVSKIDLFGREEKLPPGSDHAVFVGRSPVYLVSSGTEPLAIIPAEQRELDAPAEVQHVIGSPASVTVLARNPGRETVSRSLAIRSPDGSAVSEKRIRLSPRASERAVFSLPAPPAAGGGLQTRSFSVELKNEATGAVLIALPLLVQESYPILPEGRASGAPPLAVRETRDVTELAFDPRVPVWRGPKDLSAEARVTRDGDHLVFRFDVTDDRHAQAGHPDSQLWRADSVQVAFYNPANRAHTLFDIGLVEGKGPVVWCGRNADKDRDGLWGEKSVPRTVRREGDRTRYELRVPLDFLGLDPKKIPADGLPVRFAFLVNEDDGQGRVRWLRWAGGLGDNQSISALGHAVLR